MKSLKFFLRSLLIYYVVKIFCYFLKNRFFNGEFNYIKYVYFYSIGLRVEYKWVSSFIDLRGRFVFVCFEVGSWAVLEFFMGRF